MDNKSLIKSYLSTQITYERSSGYLVFPTDDLNMRVVAEIRGRGSLDALVLDVCGEVNPNKVQELKAELGLFISQAIAEKVKRDFPVDSQDYISSNQQKLF